MYFSFVKRFKSIQGFTLSEILLSISLMAIIGGMIIPMYRTFLIRDDLDIAATTLAQNLRRAQALSQAADGDTTWGVSSNW
jgi:prepilin-type N-terminal cleavage/methylation domain-containing protein